MPNCPILAIPTELLWHLAECLPDASLISCLFLSKQLNQILIPVFLHRHQLRINMLDLGRELWQSINASKSSGFQALSLWHLAGDFQPPRALGCSFSFNRDVFAKEVKYVQCFLVSLVSSEPIKMLRVSILSTLNFDIFTMLFHSHLFKGIEVYSYYSFTPDETEIPQWCLTSHTDWDTLETFCAHFSLMFTPTFHPMMTAIASSNSIMTLSLEDEAMAQDA